MVEGKCIQVDARQAQPAHDALEGRHGSLEWSMAGVDRLAPDAITRASRLLFSFPASVATFAVRQLACISAI
jgi:hypothetical protein